MDKELQIESGSYTRITNKIIEELVKVPLLGAEFAICFFVIRKTYGFQKKQDEISITQFEQGIERSRPTIVKALKRLQLVNILTLVKKGTSKKQSNCWVFNKYYTTWRLVKGAELVKQTHSTSKEIKRKLVKGYKHTKENTKETTKETPVPSTGELGNEVINLFQGMNPSYRELFKRKPQHEAAERLLTLHGFDKLKKILTFLEQRRSDRFCPMIGTPIQLEEKWGTLEKYALGLKASAEITSKPTWKIWT